MPSVAKILNDPPPAELMGESLAKLRHEARKRDDALTSALVDYLEALHKRLNVLEFQTVRR